MAQAVEGKNMLLRIEASTAGVKRRAAENARLQIFFCIAPGRGASLVWHGNSRLPGEIHERNAAAGDGTVGRFFLQAFRGKFAGGIF
jgi:hypothetical protein